MTKHIAQADLANMDNRHRVNFINSLSGYKSANLIGTSSRKNEDNLAIVSSVVHLGAPSLIGFIMRPVRLSAIHWKILKKQVFIRLIMYPNR